jgi:hypothetical protein
MGSIFGGGSSGGGGQPTPDTTTQFIREAPGIEERKIELMDIARQTAQTPLTIPQIQVQGLSPLEQAAITQAGQTGVGSQAVGQAVTGTQASMAAPNIQQFYNPFQSYVIDEINRQSAIQQNKLAGQAVGAGAFGGGRQGIQAAEQERARLGQVGQAQAVGFQSALQAAQQQQQAQRAGAAQLGTLGQLQQEMAGTDISRQLLAGGLQRQVDQAQLDAARQTQLQRSAEPLQRLEFLSNIYAAGPKSTSGITAATLPQSSPLAQSIGTGLGVAQAYQGITNPAAQTAAAKFNTGGIVDLKEVKKFSKGGSTADTGETADDAADDISDEILTGTFGDTPQYISPEQRRNLMLRPLTSALLQAKRTPGQSDASAAAQAFGVGLEGQQDAALELTKYDAAVRAAKEKAKKTDPVSQTILATGAQLGTGDPDDEYYATFEGGVLQGAPTKTYDISEEKAKITKVFKDRGLQRSDQALRQIENYISLLAKKGQMGNLPGVGTLGGRTPGVFTSAEGKKLRQLIAQFSNIRLKERSGAAVTESELNRFMEELAGGETTTNEAVLLSALADARTAIEKEKVEVLSSFGDTKAVKRYLEDGAVNFYTVPKAMQMRIGAEGLPRPVVEGLNFLDIDGQQTTFIGGIPYVIDFKSNQLVRKKKPKKKK